MSNWTNTWIHTDMSQKPERANWDEYGSEACYVSLAQIELFEARRLQGKDDNKVLRHLALCQEYLGQANTSARYVTIMWQGKKPNVHTLADVGTDQEEIDSLRKDSLTRVEAELAKKALPVKVDMAKEPTAPAPAKQNVAQVINLVPYIEKRRAQTLTR